MNIPFHLAIGVSDLEKARQFYGNILNAKEGRSSHLWVDFNFFGHQLTCHLIKAQITSALNSNPVDNRDVPIPHFGVTLSAQEFDKIENRLREQGISFFIEPQIRFKNKTGEQKTMFFKDPFEHFIEIKSYTKKQEY
ncbi:MAG: VOC family protein [Bdellovibrionales bacterium]|nr:VOC family protein [Bdellovibrionales bacterium]